MPGETPDRGVRRRKKDKKNRRRDRVAHTQSVGAIARPLRFSTNLRYLRIPSRFVPAIPICGGFVYLLILSLDVRGRLGLASKRSARGYRSPPGSPKRGLGRAPRCTPARGIGLFASGGTRTRRTKARPTSRAKWVSTERRGLRPALRRTFAAASRGSRRRLIFKRVFRKTADMRN